MARFLGAVKGNKGGVTRLGTPNSGMTTSCNGWNLGVDVIASVDEKGRDVFHIYKTGGSNNDTRVLVDTVIGVGDDG